MVFWLTRVRGHGRATADAAEQTLLPSQAPAHLHGLLIAHREDRINLIELQHRRNKTSSNPLDAMGLGGLSRQHSTGLAQRHPPEAVVGVASRRAQPVMAAGAHPRHKGIDLTSVSRQDLQPWCVHARLDWGVVELPKQIGVGNLAHQLLGQVMAPFMPWAPSVSCNSAP